MACGICGWDKPVTTLDDAVAHVLRCIVYTSWSRGNGAVVAVSRRAFDDLEGIVGAKKATDGR